jgi:hypothetical protein
MKVWQSVVNNPEEMLQKHQKGHFYTHAPIDMWEAINQHISLATSTRSKVLHVMVAEKIVTTLHDVFSKIIEYIQTLDTSNNPELREIELEYICAFANDTALHIEDMMELIETFTIGKDVCIVDVNVIITIFILIITIITILILSSISASHLLLSSVIIIAEIRDKIDEIFDPLTSLLVSLGQTCLKRLASLVLNDVQVCCYRVWIIYLIYSFIILSLSSLLSLSPSCLHSYIHCRIY